MKRNLQCLVKALSDRSYALIEAPVRNLGALAFRKGVDMARILGILPKPVSGDGILIVNLTSHFGDGIMLLPMLEAIHKANPDTPVDVACSRGVDGLFAAVPFLRHVYAAPLPSSPPLKLREVIERRFAIVRWYRETLATVHPAICLMPRWGDDLFGSLSLAYLIGSPTRIAYNSSVDPHQRNAPQRDRTATHLVTGGEAMHESERFLRLASQAGLLSPGFCPDTDAVSPIVQTVAANVSWEPLRKRLSLPDNGSIAILAPGASHPRRVWPAESWIELALRILQKGIKVVLLAGTADRPMVESIATSLNSSDVFVVAGSTTLPESLAIIAHAALFAGADSGPGHAAGALGIPTVILYSSHADVYPDHPASPARVRPMGPNVHIVHPSSKLDRCRMACIANEAHCIATISPERVLRSIEHAMDVSA